FTVCFVILRSGLNRCASYVRLNMSQSSAFGFSSISCVTGTKVLTWVTNARIATNKVRRISPHGEQMPMGHWSNAKCHMETGSIWHLTSGPLAFGSLYLVSVSDVLQQIRLLDLPVTACRLMDGNDRRVIDLQPVQL